MMSGTLCDEPARPPFKAHDEPFLAGMMMQLGRLLTEFYFPEEATLIRGRVEPAWQRGEWSQSVEDRAVADVLGLSYEQLGIGVTKVWGLPDSLRKAISRPEGELPARIVDAAAGAPALVRRRVGRAGARADAGAGGHDAQQGIYHRRALRARAEPAQGTVRGGGAQRQSHLQSMSTDLGIDLKADSKARRLLPQPLVVPTVAPGGRALRSAHGRARRGSAPAAAAAVSTTDKTVVVATGTAAANAAPWATIARWWCPPTPPAVARWRRRISTSTSAPPRCPPWPNLPAACWRSRAASPT